MVDVILRADVENLGSAGEVVHVRPGFARNYLIPQGLALEATEGNRRMFEEERRQSGRTVEREKAHAEDMASELEGVSLTFTMRAGEEGRLFGSVTNADISEALEKDGLQVDRRDIVLEEPIKELGVYRVPIRLHADVEPVIRVWVVAQE
jgi:large subunit ribosomal protein L9